MPISAEQATVAADDIAQFRKLLRRNLGHPFDEDTSEMLAGLLTRRAKALAMTPSHYLDKFASAPRAEIADLAEELTVTETSFFRNSEHMQALEEVAFPDRAKAKDCSRTLRILSAGCASGEEPYTLAMMAKVSPAFLNWTLSIQAIDINAAALKRAAAGRYSPWSLRQTSTGMRSRFFREDGQFFVLNDDIRGMVEFSQRNLAEDDASFWKSDSFDIVLCRNALMYFTPEAARQAVARIARSLVPGGYLFLGHAETLRELSDDFHLVHSHSTFYYRRNEKLSGRPFSPPLPTNPAPHSKSDEIPLASDISWFDNILKASERVRALTGAGCEECQSPRPVHKRGDPDIAVVLDLVMRERFDEARVQIEAMPVGDVRSPGILLLRAVLATHGRDLLAAERHCLALLEHDAKNAGAHYLLALCLESRNDVAGAGRHSRIATQLDPAFSMPRLHLGRLARRAKACEAARSELRLALPLLEKEEPDRIVLFGGGFGREPLMAMCRAELAACGGAP